MAALPLLLPLHSPPPTPSPSTASSYIATLQSAIVDPYFGARHVSPSLLREKWLQSLAPFPVFDPALSIRLVVVTKCLVGDEIKPCVLTSFYRPPSSLYMASLPLSSCLSLTVPPLRQFALLLSALNPFRFLPLVRLPPQQKRLLRFVIVPRQPCLLPSESPLWKRVMKSVWHFKVFDKFFKTVDLTSVTDFADKGFLCALTWTSPDPPSMLQVLSSIGSAST